MKPTLLILAAGTGSRFGGLKQMESFGPNNETILEYSIYDAIRAGFGKITFVIRNDFEEAFKQCIGAKVAERIEVDYVYQDLNQLPAGYSLPAERTKPWGTGHAIWVAKDAIAEPFGVINADDFYGRSAFEVLFKFLSQADESNDTSLCLIGYRLANTLSDFGSVTRGICEVDDNDYLVNLEEHFKIEKTSSGSRSCDANGNLKTLSEDAVTSMNLFGFTPSVFEHLESLWIDFLEKQGGDLKEEFLIPTAVDKIISRGHAKLKVLMTDEKWFGLTYPEDVKVVRTQIEDHVSKGTYPSALM
jgi:NDP-sugar pyrophosphorylase family protein